MRQEMRQNGLRQSCHLWPAALGALNPVLLPDHLPTYPATAGLLPTGVEGEAVRERVMHPPRSRRSLSPGLRCDALADAIYTEWVRVATMQGYWPAHESPADCRAAQGEQAADARSTKVSPCLPTVPSRCLPTLPVHVHVMFASRMHALTRHRSLRRPPGVTNTESLPGLDAPSRSILIWRRPVSTTWLFGCTVVDAVRSATRWLLVRTHKP